MLCVVQALKQECYSLTQKLANSQKMVTSYEEDAEVARRSLEQESRRALDQAEQRHADRLSRANKQVTLH